MMGVGHGGIRSAVIITVDRPGDVDAVVGRGREAGATVTKEPMNAEFARTGSVRAEPTALPR